MQIPKIGLLTSVYNIVVVIVIPLLPLHPSFCSSSCHFYAYFYAYFYAHFYKEKVPFLEERKNFKRFKERPQLRSKAVGKKEKDPGPAENDVTLITAWQ